MKLKKIISLSLILPVVLSCSCSQGDSYVTPELEYVEQTNTTDHHILVNEQTPGVFTTSIALKQDIYNTMIFLDIPAINPIAFEGENIEDLTFSILKDGTTGRLFTGDNYYRDNDNNYVFTLKLNVNVNSNWKRKGVLRKITSITYSILNLELVSPVNVNIYEDFDSYETFSSCESIENSSILFPTGFKYYCESTLYDDFHWTFKVGLFWKSSIGRNENVNIESDEAIRIKSIYFHFNLIKFDNLSISVYDEANGPYDDADHLSDTLCKIEQLDFTNSDYVLSNDQTRCTSRLYLDSTFANTSTGYREVSDFLEMEYSLNDSTETKKVLLSSIQLFGLAQHE